MTYPAGSDSSDTDFETIRPAFADDELLQLLVAHDVVVNAKPIDEGRSLLVTILLSFGPVILLVALFIWLGRRAGGGAAGALAGLGRSRAKRYDAAGQPRVTFEDVAGIDEAEDELVEIVDFLTQPGPLPAARRARSRAACCCRGRRAPARRCSRGPSPARPTCRSSRCRPRSSSR